MSDTPHHEPLSGADTTWLRLDEPTNAMTINALMRFDAPLGHDRLLEMIRRRLLPFRRFRQHVDDVEADRPCWEPCEDFELYDHLDQVRLDDGDDDDLRRAIDVRINQRLDLTRPAWEVVHIEGLADGGDAVLVRIHHSVADGFSLLFLMLALIDDPDAVDLPTGHAPPPPRPIDVDEAPDTSGTMQAALDFVRAVRHLPAQHIPALLADSPLTSARLLTLSRQTETSLVGALNGEQATAWTKTFDVNAVKDYAHANDSTVNDALLAILAGGLRRYLEDNDEPPQPDLDLRCAVPVNLLPFEEREEAFGNGFGLVYVELPVGAPSAAARLSQVHTRMNALKRSSEAFVVMGLLEVVGLLPRAVHRWIVDMWFRNRATCVTTNLPGPKEPISIGGAEVSDLMFWVPQSVGIGLGFSILSYAGRVRLGVIADKARVSDPTALAKALDAEFEELGVQPCEPTP